MCTSTTDDEQVFAASSAWRYLADIISNMTFMPATSSHGNVRGGPYLGQLLSLDYDLRCYSLKSDEFPVIVSRLDYR